MDGLTVTPVRFRLIIKTAVSDYALTQTDSNTDQASVYCLDSSALP